LPLAAAGAQYGAFAPATNGTMAMPANDADDSVNPGAEKDGKRHGRRDIMPAE